MSQHTVNVKELDRYAAKLAKRAQRNLADAPSAATLATRLAIEQMNHDAAQALLREQKKGNALYRALAQEALALLESTGKANAVAIAQTWTSLGHRLVEASAMQDKLISEAVQARRKIESAARARSANASKAANALHDKAGGSRDKAEQMRQHWASGKYSSRDICAEQESADLEMSFGAARKALYNTPDPKRNA